MEIIVHLCTIQDDIDEDGIEDVCYDNIFRLHYTFNEGGGNIRGKQIIDCVVSYVLTGISGFITFLQCGAYKVPASYDFKGVMYNNALVFSKKTRVNVQIQKQPNNLDFTGSISIGLRIVMYVLYFI